MPSPPGPRKSYFCGGRQKDRWGGGSSRKLPSGKGPAAGTPFISRKEAQATERHQELLQRCQPSINIVFGHRMTLASAKNNFASFARQLKEQRFPGSDAPNFVENTVKLMMTELRRRMAGQA